MAENGVLTLSTRNETVEEGRIAELNGGNYVVISVADTGSGSPPSLTRVLSPSSPPRRSARAQVSACPWSTASRSNPAAP